MSNRLFNPDIQFSDSTGAPYSGGKLFFYASGTSTKQNTYSDSGLTIANANPVVLDSAGRAGPIFLQNLQYKVILAPSTDTDPPTSPIWTQDPVYSSDYSTAAQFLSGSGSPNGSVAGSAGSATIKASSYWDYTNNILYVCTTTGTAATAVWTAVNASTAAAVVPAPQGRLTLTSGTPIITQDVVAATTVYYTPYLGLLVPIYNGTTMVPTSIVSELQYTLTSSLVASNIYDLYLFSLNGVVTLGSGPSWSAGTAGSITAGSCARGTGAGGSALSRVQGILTNAVSMTMRYGSGTTTTTVAANQGTYVGSLFMDSTNGQVSCYVSWGQSRKYGLWNAYNRSSINLLGGDTTSTWTNYNSGTWRQSRANSGNTITSFSGLAEEAIDVRFVQTVLASANASGNMLIGVGLNSTVSPSGKTGNQYGSSAATLIGTDIVAEYFAPPLLGINAINMIENSNLLTNQWYGGNTQMQMSVTYRA